MPKRSTTRRQTVHSNTYRFFVAHSAIQGSAVQIDDPALVHQLTNVLRLGEGDEVVLLDGSGWQYTVVLAEAGRSIHGIVVHKEAVAGEPRTHVTLYLALMRPERFEWALQKATELGVSRFVPLMSEHTIGDLGELSKRKYERWQKIVREAAEQARRGVLPELAPTQAFALACEQAAQSGPAFFLWEGGAVESLRLALTRTQAASAPDQPSAISIMSGPEGGFAESERDAATRCGLIPVSLGPRTLRAETAPIVAASAILYALGELE